MKSAISDPITVTVTATHHDRETGSREPSSSPPSNTLEDSILLNAVLGPSQHDVIRDWVQRETPPSAPNVAAVRESCQHWTMRVLERLQEGGIVARGPPGSGGWF